MLYVGIDLAERHSAAVALADDLEVVIERTIDSGPAVKQEHPWKRIQTYLTWVSDLIVSLPPNLRLVIEEPYPHAVNVAPSYRIQGAIIAHLQELRLDESQVTITKSKPWQDYFGYTKNEFGNSKSWAALMCDGFGYDLPGSTLGRKTKAKEREDLRDAYLLARWLRETNGTPYLGGGAPRVEVAGGVAVAPETRETLLRRAQEMR